LFSPAKRKKKIRMKHFILLAVLSSQVGSLSAFCSSKRPQVGVSKCQRSELFASLDPLGSEGDWTAYLDEDTTGLIYYFNGMTGESLWEPPTKSFPKVSLDAPVKRLADTKRAEYEKTILAKQQQETPKEEKKKGFLAALLEDEPKATSTAAVVKETKEKPKKTKDKPEEDDWFSFLNQPTTTAAATVTEPKPTSTTVAPTVKEVNGAGASTTEGTAATTEQKPSFFDRILVKTRERATTETVEEPKPMTKEVPEEIIVPELKPIQVTMASYVLPHPAKIFWGGEDAVFTATRTFGLFDGVSGATKLDGVPLYSKILAKEMKKAVGSEGLNIQELTKRLTAVAEIADKKATGASTAIVASISEDGFLRALNLGDSSCVVIRNGKVAAKTRDSTHYFDCPYQLSTDSPDRPRDGTKLNLELLRGDLLLMASDGIFDNLSDEQIVQVVASSPQRLSSIAKRVGDESRKASLNRKAVTPYAKAAKKNGSPDYIDGVGGKLDDVSCIVVRYE
jgi:protein phosphatase PTC7